MLYLLHSCKNLLRAGTLKRFNVILTKLDKKEFNEYKKDIVVGDPSTSVS